jgi:hypothetical protein
MNRMAVILTAWRLPLLLMALCVALAIGLAGIVGAPVAPSAGPSRETEATADDAVADRSFELEPLASFAAIVERPLFSRSRRPQPLRNATADARTGNAGAPFLLSGVIIAGATRVAFLQPRSQPKTLRVLEGETVDGWKIEKILPQRVVIGNGEAREELFLQDRITPTTPDGRLQPRAGRPPPPGREGMPGQQFQRGDDVGGAVENEPQ